MTATPPPLPPRIDLRSIADRYDIVLCDVWGVVHNGVAAWPTACEALARFRDGGGTVVLVSNSPRPSADVVRQLDEVGVPREAWDRFVTSGDLTVAEIRERGVRRLHHIGPPRDLSIFDILPVTLTGVEAAEIAVVTGLDRDEEDTPALYHDRLAAIRARDLVMICANPDRVVQRGDRLIWCAGAIAEDYEAMGGAVVYTGKPFRPIYEAALATAADAAGAAVDAARVLAIGDAVHTDLAGAFRMGIDVVFVTGGIHAGEIGDPPDPVVFARLLAPDGIRPVGWAHRLSWT